ncbi:MAG: hypothetical protein A3I71_00425 [Omnitrophica WOR_2 bacterium RIFCSPLOWO2_02_FULL_63_16]|nr:MAG: hypothetical protein A2Z92_02010 [Omnitrophica WOR_2 bacterium GWA2_63_20]OGX17747.1 MAG: hypothetical protein A2105_06335 [Omnitrophica WOR_2 bacterium GWF2_63_9]OGX35975.1 MAG: hypothetical protein A3B73_01670 [Omnitrophica WOR_2 bacterium RIFCSPHIGHO2_02_FULL_63_39]OGX45649.1 MAG: hypothetical protein A3I71_00425 [Omnitrophica WOR_2 bacterium RIFCSPLOWO2_02_FULL_63_16]OGX49652.1 MAG: hypothetical protein A3G88_02905 [Omnitrophica WOR_2 bacterium RIFCSPLOWO2_12_FULL_63_16]HAM40967.1 
MGSPSTTISNGTVSTGWSAHPDALTAGETAGQMAVGRMKGHRPRCAVVLASSWFDQAKLLTGLRRALPDVALVGGSTAGEILPEGPTSHHCVVLAIGDEALAVSTGLGEAADREPRLAGHEAALQALRGFEGRARSGFLLFGDGLLTGYTEVVRGIHEVLGTHSLVTGALTADDLRFAQTYQYHNDDAVSRSVVGLLIGGSCAMGVGLEHGFAPISRMLRATSARGNLLRELDGAPAAHVYEEYLGRDLMETARQAGLTRQLIAYPLGIQLESSEAFLLRCVRRIEPDGSLLCTGEIPAGSTVRLMIGNKELALEAASRAAEQALRPLSKVSFVLVFDSVSRRTLLGFDAAQDIHRIRKIVGLATPLVGCYTYGEHAPLQGAVPHGQSVVQTGAVLVLAVGSP